nr:mechanosensitive ion channel family protein [Flocculibacter collagenilyticus]
MKDLIHSFLSHLPYSEALSSVSSFVVFILIGLVTFYAVQLLFMPVFFSVLARITSLEAVRPRHKKALSLYLSHLGFVLVWLNFEEFYIGHLASIKGASFILSHIYFYIVVGLIITAILNLIGSLYNQLKFSRDVPIKGLIQVLKLLTFIVTTILLISILVNKSPLYLLSGIGALTAVLILVFKDTILGFVASIQIAANRLVAIGDWIEVEKYGADGEVLDLGLNTVKVKNWDNTVTSIPTYALISDSFKNWRGMQESQGRRIKRAILIDIQSIKAISDDEKTQISKQLNDFLFQERTQTNLGLFREYVEAQLKHHPRINHNMTCMVRQLPPGAQGLPLEIYCFSQDKNWVSYEHIQASVIESIYTQLVNFDLRAFQAPTGQDFSTISQPSVLPQLSGEHYVQ